MKIAYVDMIGGASGNMLFGAFVDAGADLDHIESLLRTIPVEGWSILTERVEKRGVPALYVDVVVPGEDHHHHHESAHKSPAGMRRLSEVAALFERSGLSARQGERCVAIATRLAAAEAEAHGMRVEEMRFHAIGQIDAVIDIAASVIALDLLEIERLYCSAYPIGGKHSREIALLIGDAPQHKEAIDNWMVTTTAAAVLATLVEQPGLRPNLRLERAGVGAGLSDFPIPNVTRIEIGEMLDP